MAGTAVTAFDDAIEHVYREHGARLWRALLGFTGDPDVASEALAEAFAQALARRDGLRSPIDWIWSASFRIGRGLQRDGGRSHPLVDETSYEPADPVRDIVRALAQIPERQRMSIVLHDYADRPASEVAAILGIAPATVYVHLHHGRKRLRQLLEVSDA